MAGITKEYLEQEYVANRKTKMAIAKECGVSHQTIREKMKKFHIPTRDSDKPITMIGRRIGTNEVLERITMGSRIKYRVRCDCGFERVITYTSLYPGKKYRAKHGSPTRRCSRCNSGQSSKRYTGYKKLSGRRFGHYRKGAAIRGIGFKITIKDAYEQL